MSFFQIILFLELAESETNVTAQLGGSVFLSCSVMNYGDRAITFPTVSSLGKTLILLSMNQIFTFHRSLGCAYAIGTS